MPTVQWITQPRALDSIPDALVLGAEIGVTPAPLRQADPVPKATSAPYSAFAAKGLAWDVMSSGAKSFCNSMTRAPGCSKSIALRSTIWICKPL